MLPIIQGPLEIHKQYQQHNRRIELVFAVLNEVMGGSVPALLEEGMEID